MVAEDKNGLSSEKYNNSIYPWERRVEKETVRMKERERGGVTPSQIVQTFETLAQTVLIF